MYHWLLRRADCKTYAPKAPAADQAAALEAATLPPSLFNVPPELAAAIARFKLDTAAD